MSPVLLLILKSNELLPTLGEHNSCVVYLDHKCEIIRVKTKLGLY